MDKEIERWYKRLWETKGNRFNAYRRLQAHDQWSITTISLVSIYIISMNMLVFVETRPSFLTDNIITISNISLSIVALVFSLLLSLKDYKLKSHQFHACGREISELYDKVCLWKNSNHTVNLSDIEKLAQNYTRILDKYNINHTPLDYAKFKISNRQEYKNEITIRHVIQINIQYFLSTYFIYWLFITVPLFLFFIIWCINW